MDVEALCAHRLHLLSLQHWNANSPIFWQRRTIFLERTIFLFGLWPCLAWDYIYTQSSHLTQAAGQHSEVKWQRSANIGAATWPSRSTCMSFKSGIVALISYNAYITLLLDVVAKRFLPKSPTSKMSMVWIFQSIEIIYQIISKSSWTRSDNIHVYLRTKLSCRIFNGDGSTLAISPRRTSHRFLEWVLVTRWQFTGLMLVRALPLASLKEQQY